jgi:hypothetical protein
VRRHRFLEVGDGHVLEWSDLDDAGVVDQHVDAAAVVHDPADGPLDLGAIEDVALDGGDAAALLLDIGGRTLELLLVTGGQHDVGAGRSELPRHRQAEAARPADDGHRLASEVDRPPRA